MNMWYKVQKNEGGNLIDKDGDKCILIETEVAYCLLDEETLGKNEECGFRWFSVKKGAMHYYGVTDPNEAPAEQK